MIWVFDGLGVGVMGYGSLVDYGVLYGRIPGNIRVECLRCRIVNQYQSCGEISGILSAIENDCEAH